MEHRSTRQILAVLLGCLSFALNNAQKPMGTDDRPNLILIMTDQQRFDAMSIAGNTILDTPNIDRLGNEGCYFTNAYTTSPVCGPARASLFTGLSTESTGVRRNNEPAKEGLKTYDQWLVKNEGYNAAYHGKWHSPNHFADVYQDDFSTESFNLFKPYRSFLTEQGFDVPATKIPNGTVLDTLSTQPYYPNPVDNRYNTDKFINPRKLCECDQYGVSVIGRKNTLTAHYTRRAIRSLARMVNAKKPFSLHLSLNAPHAPHTPSRPFADWYKAENMPIPFSINDRLHDSRYKHHRKERFADPKTVGHMIAVYYAQIKEVDVWIGHLLRRVEELDVTNNTMIVFTSDHGEMLGAHGMIEKNIMYEESVRVPLLIRYPDKIKAGTVVDEPVSHRDIFATIFDYLEAPKRQSEGFSLRRYIEKKPRRGTPFTVAESGKLDDLMLRAGAWKLILPKKADSKSVNCLYNLEWDPHEMNNLLGPSSNRRQEFLPQARLLRKLLADWCIATNSPHLKDIRQRKL